MSGRRTWTKGNFHLSYSQPQLTSFRDDEEILSVDDILYFYYDVHLISGTKTRLKMSSYDYPKVHLLPKEIDDILSFDMKKAYLLHDYKEEGYERQTRYHQVMIANGLGGISEYYYKIERYDTWEKTGACDPKEETWYVLTIGEMEKGKTYGGMEREEYGLAMAVYDITTEELEGLKHVAESFCDEAIRLYHDWLEEYRKEEKQEALIAERKGEKD